MTYDKLIETDKTMAENQQVLISKVPMKIFVSAVALHFKPPTSSFS
jgi:hypothetical protein